MIKKLILRPLMGLIDLEAKRDYSKWRNNKPISTSDKEWFLSLSRATFLF